MVLMTSCFSYHAALPTLKVNLDFFFQIKRYLFICYYPIKISSMDLVYWIRIHFSTIQRVFMEADMMAKKYKQKLPPHIVSTKLGPLPTSALPFENEALYANWKWFKFEKWWWRHKSMKETVHWDELNSENLMLHGSPVQWRKCRLRRKYEEPPRPWVVKIFWCCHLFSYVVWSHKEHGL